MAIVSADAELREELELRATEILDHDRMEYYRTVKNKGSQLTVHGILSVHQEKMRLEREVLAEKGVPDNPNLRGMYKRAFNHKSRNLPSRARLEADPWKQRHIEFYDDGVAGAWIPSVRRPEIVGGQHYLPGVDSWAGLPDFTRPRHRRFLDRYQRCRIRAAVREDPSMSRRQDLADFYGVPTWVIYRLAVS